MVVQFDILRKEKKAEKQYTQSIRYEYENPNESVANALRQINRRQERKDIKGNPVSVIKWECSCLQKKCGACAMLINGKPGLACDARLAAYKTETIRLAPLRKFPVVEDLIVDRSILYENLKEMEAWLAGQPELREQGYEAAYEGSRCLQCGCCLEICPNFYAGGNFFGMASMVPVARILEELNENDRKSLIKEYKKHIYSGCGKSLACRNICPAQIDIEGLLVNSNALSVWKAGLRRHGGV